MNRAVMGSRNERVIFFIKDSLLLESTPSDVTNAAKRGQRQKQFAEGQEQDTSKPEKSALFDHGLTPVF
tara:strand:- start:140 stop:346 length:207 start_codon:yes stop_codon:yes gene_type:complete